MQRSSPYSLNFYLPDQVSWMAFTWYQAVTSLGLPKPAWVSGALPASAATPRAYS